MYLFRQGQKNTEEKLSNKSPQCGYVFRFVLFTGDCNPTLLPRDGMILTPATIERRSVVSLGGGGAWLSPWAAQKTGFTCWKPSSARSPKTAITLSELDGENSPKHSPRSHKSPLRTLVEQ